MKTQAPPILDEVLPALESHFGEYKVVSAEEDLMEMIEYFTPKQVEKFKGFIDLIIETPDEKYHIIDWKTCSGAGMLKRSDPMMTYQLTFYKHFWAKKHKVDPKKIETYFALLKRTATKNRVEIRVTSGPKTEKRS